MKFTEVKTKLEQEGCAILDEVYTNNEVKQILNCIENSDKENRSFLKTKDLFAIRQLINTIPELSKLIFSKKLKELLFSLFKEDYFLTKAIYFDKPSKSNWFVGYHQDLSISVDKKVEEKNYINWTFKKGQYGVQPPIEILEDTITVRIHLDDTKKENGALRVIPQSHLKGIIRIDSEYLKSEEEQVCEVNRGGIMLMKPLTFHASNRTTNSKQRRVIHLEFNKHKLKEPINWLEYLAIDL